jgi:hypothetical protein
VSDEKKETPTRERRLTIRQDRFVDAIVEGADSLADAGRTAGYSEHPATLYPESSRTASLPKVQREIGIREAMRRDSARAIFDASGETLLRRVQEPNAPDALVVASYKTSADVIASGVGGEPATEASAPATYYRRLFRHALRRAWAAGARHTHAHGLDSALQLAERNDARTDAWCPFVEVLRASQPARKPVSEWGRDWTP